MFYQRGNGQEEPVAVTQCAESYVFDDDAVFILSDMGQVLTVVGIDPENANTDEPYEIVQFEDDCLISILYSKEDIQQLINVLQDLIA